MCLTLSRRECNLKEMAKLYVVFECQGKLGNPNTSESEKSEISQGKSGN